MPRLKVVVLVGTVAILLVGCGSGRRESGEPPASATASAPSSATASTETADTTDAANTTSTANSGVPLIDHTLWTATTKGRQLQVFPTALGRTDGASGAGDRAWAEVLADAPDARTAGMYDQFLCHWNFARIIEPNKPSWNLEPWRPSVGYQATVAAACNPGGSEG